MKRVPIILQMSLILFCVMAIPITILTWYSDKEILHNSENVIAESSLAELNANRRLNENALKNISQAVAGLKVTKVFDLIRYFETYDELNANYDNVSNALVVQHELVNLKQKMAGVYSSYFYLSDSDYVISTDQGITTLDHYESIGWMKEALSKRTGIGGVWYPRKLNSGINVVSYVLPLNRLSTPTRGIIVLNLQESRIADYFRSSGGDKQGYFLMEADGTIISHNDKSLLLTDGGQLPFIGGIVQNGSKEGYAFHNAGNERLIYTWSRSEQLGWWNVNVYSMDELMTKAHTLQRNIIVLTIMIIFIGAVLTFLIANWFSRPVRELARTVRTRSDLGVSNRNELVFLDAAFKRMQKEEEELFNLLKERELDARSLAVHNLLRGEVNKQVHELFPLACYSVAIVSIDRYREYVNFTNLEARNYHRYIFISKCDTLFPDTVHARTVYQGEGCFAIVMNDSSDDINSWLGMFKASLTAIQNSALEFFGHTVTLGVSSRGESGSEVSNQVAEAMEIIKKRMTEGSGCIFFWEKEADEDIKYMYPTNSERRIVNYLTTGDIPSILNELQVIRQEIQSAEYISYDNILFIYNQLIGLTIKYLRENNINTARIFTGRRDIYSAIASIDTLDEMEDYLNGFFTDIGRHLSHFCVQDSYGERIIGYLQEHFCEDIAFQDLAREIGISYSYMRKIVYELTGKTLIDYTNHLRIEKAKKILGEEPNLTMTQVAEQVGYYNVQSLNRFFRKYEGMSPGSYKAFKHAKSTDLSQEKEE
ncbi:AraC family transcriptional regulator [Paenibacillus donghaensis]|uniref:AraC family transcriptional regulator n=1 Tax=Paenibacillus donghaensis TaxID=414771 RepID=A0A2Z2KHE7_9BACL|nr:AraC family transcriptional regulator [Paenibacillus donghaensis]ASA21599.1 AraC family transcriptional regulator [Paenibacillus donghaensis]